MIYKELTVSDFRDEFQRMGRGEQFSYEGLGVLYDYLNEDEYELDVIALCCEFTESTLDEALQNYDLDTANELERHTLVLYIDRKHIIYQNF